MCMEKTTIKPSLCFATVKLENNRLKKKKRKKETTGTATL